MDELDRRIVNTLQHRFPVCERPFRAAATELGTTEEKLIARVDRLLAEGTLTRFGPLFQVERMGGAFTLAAMSVPPERFDKVAEVVNSFPEVAHNYAREHALNMWFVLATEGPEDTAAVVRAIERRTGLAVLLFPKEREFFVELKLEAPSAAGPSQGANCAPAFGGSEAAELADEAASVGVHMSAAGPPQGANCAPAFGGSAAAELADEAASVGVHMSAAGPSQGANCAPASGGSAAAELASEAASVGVHHP